MKTIVPWVDRTFDFRNALELAPSTLERLRGAPARLEDRLRALDPQILTTAHGGKWSIQEHAGHLGLAEELFLSRLDDYDRGLRELTPAEMTNRRVGGATFNDRSLEDVLGAFRAARGELIGRLESQPDGGVERSAWHTRLGMEMRVCDLMLFIAEHDDHHMARITETLRG